MIKVFTKFFDKLEDRVRVTLSHRSFLYAFIGGAAHVIFWRGIWHSADMIQAKGGFWAWLFYEPVTVVWASLVLLLTGLFVATFIGERVIISGLKHEKKVTDQTADDIEREEAKLININAKLNALMKDVAEIKDVLVKK